MSNTTIQSLVSAVLYGKAEKLIKMAFPDARTTVLDLHVQALFVHLWNKLDDATCQKIGAPKPDPTQLDSFNAAIMQTMQPDGKPYYLAHATHSRIVEPGKHSFTSHLPLVRVSLALTDATATDISTSIGDVCMTDRLFQSVEQANFKLKSELGGQTVARLDVITPARSLGARFGAIAVYIGYFADAAGAPNKDPGFYILETGTATGDTMIYYLSPDLKPIETKRKWFAPTPFTTDAGFYTGDLVLNGDEPTALHVKAMNPNKEVEVTVDVVYEQTAPLYIYPAILTAEAAGRVGAIAIKKGMLEFEEILAPLGWALAWNSPPQ